MPPRRTARQVKQSVTKLLQSISEFCPYPIRFATAIEIRAVFTTPITARKASAIAGLIFNAGADGLESSDPSVLAETIKRDKEFRIFWK